MSSARSDRHISLDILSCGMYFAIILYHTTIYFARYPFSSFPHLTDVSVAGYVDFAMMQFGLLGVPFFFMRVGFFMLSRQRERFLSASLGKLLGLAAFYLSIYVVVLIIAIGKLPDLRLIARFALWNDAAGIVGSTSISKIPMYFVWDSWFIYALIPLYFLVPILAKTESLIDLRAATVGVVAIYVFVFVGPPLGVWLEVPLSRTPNELYFSYILFGYWAYCARDHLARLRPRVAGFAFAILFALNLGVGLWLYAEESPLYITAWRNYFNMTSPLLCMLLIAISLSVQWRIPDVVGTAAGFVAKAGIDIYLAHTLFLVLLLGSKVWPDTPMLPIKQMLSAVAVMALSVAAAAFRIQLFRVVAALWRRLGRMILTRSLSPSDGLPASSRLKPRSV